MKKAVDILSMAGFDVQNNYASQYELILEANLRTRQDRVVFRAIEDNFQFITEIRLHMQDIFICDEWGLFLLNTDGKDDIKFEEHTFPDPQYFDKEWAEEAGIFYNADLSFVVNNAIVLPGLRTDRFKDYRTCIERRIYNLSGLLEIEDGCLVLNGSKNIYFNLDLPRETDLKDSTFRLRLRLKGLLFRNASMIT